MRWDPRKSLLASLLILSCPASSFHYGLSQSADKCDAGRASKIAEIFRKLNDVDYETFNPRLPPDTPSKTRYRYIRDRFIEGYQLYWNLVDLLEIECDEPCPRGVAEMILVDAAQASLLLNSISFRHFRKTRTAYIEVLEGADERLKDKLPELRLWFVPDFNADREVLKRYVSQNKPIPKWYLDRAFTCNMEDFNPYVRSPMMRGFDTIWKEYYHMGPIAAINLAWLYEEDREFMSQEENENEVYYSIHVIETYGTRRRNKRTRPEDVALATKQLKWLWDTKRWWARRYVVEVLDSSPELAFEGVIEELNKEKHPYVGPRIDELKLIDRLTERLKGKR